MTRPVPLLTLAGVCVLAAAIGGPSGPVRAQQAPGLDSAIQPMRVSSDTYEYCSKLEHRVDAMPNRTDEVRKLVLQGHQLCDHGQIRAGIADIRRALLLMKHKPVVYGQP
jgi:hypothetical protein